MKTKPLLAALAAAAPLVLWAQAPTPPPVDTTTAAPAKVAPKKPYIPHKTPLAAKGSPGKPAAPKKPAPPAPPKKPSNVPPVIYDRQGNAIPTSPDAYDVSSAKKK
jgi:hypothetical protein